ncbi:MAG: hypothetical protein AAB556_00500 [Patescibacteria group bacterium]
MSLKIDKYEKIDVLLNNDLVRELVEFLKIRNLSMEKMLSDAIPLFVLLWEESQKGRLPADINLFLPISVKSKSTTFHLYFEKDSIESLKKFTQEHAFDGIDQVINSSFVILIYLVKMFCIEEEIVFLVKNPEGKFIINLPSYFKK